MSATRLRDLTRLIFCSVLLSLSITPARAEVGATFTVASQDRFRGYSVSDGYPSATFALSYDDAAGPYVEGSVMLAGNPSDGIRRTRFEANAGYAVRLSNGPTLDAGVVHAEYMGYRIYGKQAVFTELYAGLITSHISAHVHYSPDYFQRGISSFYTDVDGTTALAKHLRLSAHYGMLFQTSGQHEQAGSKIGDWRVGLSTDVRKLNFDFALSSGSNKRSFYGVVKSGGTALIVSVGTAF